MNTVPAVAGHTVPFETALQHLGPGPIALDLETYSVNDPEGNEALDPHAGEIRLLSMCSAGSDPQLVDHMRWPIPADRLAALLAERPLIIHNTAFEARWLEAKFGIPLHHEPVFDTLIAERLLTNGLGISNSLGPTLERELGLSIPKEAGASDWGGLFLTDCQLSYAGGDVRYLHRLVARQLERLDCEGLRAVYDLEIALLPVVAHMERSGFQVDRTVLEQVETLSGNKTGRLKQLIWSRLNSNCRLNIDSPEQLKPALALAGLPVPDTKEVTLACLADPLGGLILDYRGWEMQRRQAVALHKAIASDGRIYAKFNSLGARSGRFSSNGPNLQQINKRGAMRSAFCATRGYVLIILDFSQIELRAAALASGDTRMLEALRAGVDLHKQSAANVLNKPIEALSKKERQLGKPINFGPLYGQSPAGLVEYARTKYGVIFTLQEATRFLHKHFKCYEGLAQWHAKARTRAPFVLEGRTPLGRRRLAPPDATTWDKFQLSTNFVVQGGMADGLKKSLVRLYAELPPGVRLICCVHDEAILEAPLESAEETRAWAHRAMVEEMATLLPGVPVEVESRVCANWGEKV
jgi:DNA polymerase-1